MAAVGEWESGPWGLWMGGWASLEFCCCWAAGPLPLPGRGGDTGCAGSAWGTLTCWWTWPCGRHGHDRVRFPLRLTRHLQPCLVPGDLSCQLLWDFPNPDPQCSLQQLVFQNLYLEHAGLQCHLGSVGLHWKICDYFYMFSITHRCSLEKKLDSTVQQNLSVIPIPWDNPCEHKIINFERKIFFFSHFFHQLDHQDTKLVWKKKKRKKEIVLSLAASGERFWHCGACRRWGLCVWGHRSALANATTPKGGVPRPVGPVLPEWSFVSAAQLSRIMAADIKDMSKHCYLALSFALTVEGVSPQGALESRAPAFRPTINST